MTDLKNRVLYLCYNYKGNDGFVFPSEFESDIYNPGIFILIAPYFYKFESEYIFEAYDGEKRIETRLKRINKNIFMVNTNKHGLFIFRAKLIAKYYNRYLGKHMHNIDREWLYELIPLQPNRLEEVCKASDFFFIGSVVD